MTGRYLVVGDPIEHSLSPRIHGLFATQVEMSLDYQKAQVSSDQFDAFFADFWQTGGVGANVTVPLKSLAWQHAQHLDPAAKVAGAVNTLAKREDGIWGYNTDGIGLCEDLLRSSGITLTDQVVLLVGAGGAARGVIHPLLEAGCQRIVIVNRTPAKARDLATDFQPFIQRAEQVVGCGFDALSEHLDGADIVINATSSALQPGQATHQPTPLAGAWVRDAVCYDMSYGAKATFARWAEQAGAAQSLDGLGMLIEQAAAAFKIWHGLTPQTQPVLEEIRSTI